MFNLQDLKNLRKILLASSECLYKASQCDNPKEKNNFLNNIAGQLHKDHISGACGSDLAEAADDDIAPIRDGISQITTIDDNSGNQVTKVRIRSLNPDEENDIISSSQNSIQDLLSNFSDKFGPIGSMIPDMEDGEVYDQAMEMSFDDVADKMKDKLSELLGDNIPDNFKDLLNAPWLNSSQKEGYQEGSEENTSEEVENMREPTLFPDKKVNTPPEIEGGFVWNAANDSLIRLAADLCVVDNMVKAASKDSDAISKRQLLAMLDPSRYDDLDEEVQDELIELYSGILSDQYGIKEADSSIKKMQKIAYRIVGDPEYLNTDDRRRRDGSMPPNYEEWLRNVGESHHRAFSRLEVVVNPDTETMKLRIPDGERSNPIRKELAGTEVRMRRADLNDTENSPKDSFEKKLDDNDLSGHRGTDDETTYQEKLDKKRGTKEEVTGHPEQRLEERRKTQADKSLEGQMEDAKLRQYKGFNQVVDSLLNDWRTENKDMLKQAQVNKKMIPTSIILSSPNMGSPIPESLDVIDESPLMEDAPASVPDVNPNTGPGYQSIEKMLQGPKAGNLDSLIDKLINKMQDIEDKLTFNQNPEDVPMPSTAQDAGAGAPDVHMGPAVGIPPSDNGWNSFVESGEQPIAPKPSK